MPATRPNILWIVTTQWRAQATGYAGDANARTPFLDALAASAVQFTQAVTPHPFGPFARAALFTGVPSPENGVREYFDPLPTGTRTIAHALGGRGYATGFFGKWHLGKRDPAAALVGKAHARIVVPPEARGGFATWEGFESGFLINDPMLHGSRLPHPVVFPGYQSDVLCEQALGWIERSKPWFCVVSLEPPHPPYDAEAAGVLGPPPDAIALRSNVPRGADVEARARRELAGYYAHLEATDRAVGRLIGGIADPNTIVVFTSVHGDMHGSHGLFRKGWPHEESVRVPLVVRFPDRKGGTDDAAISLLDLPALTVRWADRVEAEAVAPFSRISMPCVVDLPQQCNRTWSGMRTPQRKLILNANGTPWLFFDLEKDPGEEENLTTDPRRAEELAALRRLL